MALREFLRRSAYSRFVRSLRVFALSTLGCAGFAVAQQPDLILPFRPATIVRCSQGPGGHFSHKGVCCANDLDFGGRDRTGESLLGVEVVAAADGVAYAFCDVPDPNFKPHDCPSATSKTFGNQINIDHGNGLFTVYAHLLAFAPGIVCGGTGKQVHQGEVIGTIDNTGYSCGDHLHFGMHEGDPTRAATQSHSVSMTHLLARELPDPIAHVFVGNELVCGDPGIGRDYEAIGPLSALFNAPRDFSITANPNGVWSYGATASLGGPLTLYTVGDPSSGGVSGMDVWSFGGFLSPPFVIGNSSGSTIGDQFGFVQPPDLLQLHPTLGTYSVVRWTAPSAGIYRLGGRFQGVNNGLPTGTTTDVHVVVNGTSSFDSPLSGFGTMAPFSRTRSLCSSDKVDFAVGFGPGIGTGGQDHDSTGLAAVISQPSVPTYMRHRPPDHLV